MNLPEGFILRYEDLVELYPDIKFLVPVLVSKIPTPEMREIRKKILALLKQNKKVFLELEDLMLLYTQHAIAKHPTVYIARTKDVKTDIEYFTAKTFWPLKGGKKKEIKIYLGRADDFKNDTRSKEAKNMAQIKMGHTLRHRMKQGEL
jgi:hypothetical protein